MRAWLANTWCCKQKQTLHVTVVIAGGKTSPSAVGSGGREVVEVCESVCVVGEGGWWGSGGRVGEANLDAYAAN